MSTANSLLDELSWRGLVYQHTDGLADALPVALVCGVIFGEPEPRPELREAAVRLEPLVGGARITPEAGRALAAAANEGPRPVERAREERDEECERKKHHSDERRVALMEGDLVVRGCS